MAIDMDVDDVEKLQQRVDALMCDLLDFQERVSIANSSVSAHPDLDTHFSAWRDMNACGVLREDIIRGWRIKFRVQYFDACAGNLFRWPEDIEYYRQLDEDIATWEQDLQEHRKTISKAMRKLIGKKLLGKWNHSFSRLAGGLGHHQHRRQESVEPQPQQPEYSYQYPPPALPVQYPVDDGYLDATQPTHPTYLSKRPVMNYHDTDFSHSLASSTSTASYQDDSSPLFSSLSNSGSSSSSSSGSGDKSDCWLVHQFINLEQQEVQAERQRDKLRQHLAPPPQSASRLVSSLSLGRSWSVRGSSSSAPATGDDQSPSWVKGRSKSLRRPKASVVAVSSSTMMEDAILEDFEEGAFVRPA